MIESDFDAALRQLELLFKPGECLEIAIRYEKSAGDIKAFGELFEDRERAANYAAEQSLKPNTVGVYVSVNPHDPATWREGQKRGSSGNIPRRKHTIIDVDGEKMAARAVADSIIRFLTEFSFPDLLLVDTGNGYQIWLAIDLPANSKLVDGFLAALNNRFKTDGAHVDTVVDDPSRLGRLAGTMNRKPGKVPCLSKIIHDPGTLETVSEEMLMAVIADLLPEALPANDLPANDLPASPYTDSDFESMGGVNVDKFLSDNNWAAKSKTDKDGGKLWEIACPLRPDQTDGGTWIFQDSGGGVTAGCHHAKCKGKGWSEISAAIRKESPESIAAIRVAVDKEEKEQKKETRLAHIYAHKYLKDRKLVLHQEKIREYAGGVYLERTANAVKRDLRRLIDGEGGDCNEKIVANTYGLLSSLIPEMDRPRWVNGRESDDYIVCNNVILNLRTMETLKHTPDLFAIRKLPVDYTPGATCPGWLDFLKSLWDDDESIKLAAEMSGYTLESKNPLQSFFLLQGVPRGGKGVFMKTLCKLNGLDSVESIAIEKLHKDFSLYKAVDKSIIVISDIHTNRLAPVVGLLKAVSGEDLMQIEGKGRDSTSNYIYGKVFLSSNIDLVFGDNSGAIFDRVVGLKFTKSFRPVGHPDFVDGQEQNPDLEAKLAKELPGILLWAIEGLQRTRKNKFFTTPAASQALIEDLVSDGAPIIKFFADCLIRSKGAALLDDLYEAWQSWCIEEGYDAQAIGVKKTFSKNLKNSCPWLIRQQLRTGKRPYQFIGVELKNKPKPKAVNCME